METNLRNLLLPGAAIGLAALVSALGFMGWMNHGASMFLTLAQNGLSWCF
jgi:hypothetical protein